MSLSLMVEDRPFTVPIEIDSWEETCPILLGETSDRRLGMESAEAQDLFIRQTGFRCIPAAEGQSGSPVRCSRSPPDPCPVHRQEMGGGDFRLDLGDFPFLAHASQSTSSDTVLSPLVPCLTPALPSPACCAAVATTAGGSSASSASVPPSEPLPLPQVSQSASPLLAIVQSACVVGPLPPPLPPSVGSEPSPCSGLQLGPSHLELGLRRKAGNLGSMVDRPEPGKFVANRRSVRLAAKCRGAKKSSLSRAQDLMCQKLKLVRFSARASRSSSHSASTSASSAAPLLKEQTELLRGTPRPTPAELPDGASGGVDVSSPRSDLRDPLTPEEVQSIKLACGIIDSGAGTSLPCLSGAGPISAGVSTEGV